VGTGAGAGEVVDGGTTVVGVSGAGACVVVVAAAGGGVVVVVVPATVVVVADVVVVVEEVVGGGVAGAIPSVACPASSTMAQKADEAHDTALNRPPSVLTGALVDQLRPS
jgi:hypothetical protein